MLLITPRERTVLQLMANGNQTADIASRLGLTEREVEAGLTSLLAVMGAGSRTEAVELASRRGLLVRDDETSAEASAGVAPWNAHASQQDQAVEHEHERPPRYRRTAEEQHQ